MASRTAYVIAAWGGPRRGQDRHFNWLREHLAVLDRLPHNLTEIIVVAARCQGEAPEFRDFVAGLPARGIRVLWRDNVGLSYGSFSYAFERFGAEVSADYWIFMEDDWVVCQPDFDHKLIEMYEDERDTGYLCGLVLSGRLGIHAAISTGISSTARLQDACVASGGALPFYSRDHPLSQRAHRRPYMHQGGQVAWSQAWLHAGYKLRDVTEYGYRAFFWHGQPGHEQVQLFEGHHVRDIFRPQQADGADLSCAVIRSRAQKIK